MNPQFPATPCALALPESIDSKSRASASNFFVRLFAALLLSVCLLWSQAETGQITGTVLDPAGSAVANATVKAISRSTGSERTITTNNSGAYLISNLLPDDYTVSVEAPGFSTYQQVVTVTVGARVGLDPKLAVGQASTVVEVAEQAAQINTETQTLSTNVSQEQLRELPTLTRNPYALVALSGNVSDAAAGGRGVGYAVNGMREASTNVLLDGAANNDEFSASVGQQVPLDSVEEFSILTNNFTAEFGRASGGVVNVVTKSGSNEFHGTAYEFNRVSSLSSNSYDNNANLIPKSTFVRNQFGYSFGGPVVKNKLFFFNSTEWTRIRSAASFTAVVPTSQYIAQMAPSTQSFFSPYYKLKASDQVLATYTGSNQNLCGTNVACNTFVAANPNLPLFEKISYIVNGDAGGGAPQNHWEGVSRVDYNYSDRTQIYARYAIESGLYLPGYASASPYQGYDVGENDFNNNILVSLTHTFTPSFVSQSKAVFNRLNSLQGFGAAGGDVPTIYTSSTGAAQVNGSSVLFPGYNPSTPGSSIPFGGPQNFVQLYQDLSLSRGKHEIRFGGSFDYERDNRTFGAYEDGSYYLSTGSLGASIAALNSGNAYGFQAAIYPQGQLPGSTVSLPLSSPNFSRSNRYKEGAVYVQDSWKVMPRFTANIGLRWEHFGVQHNKNPKLDSNFYDPANQIDTPLGIREGQVSLVPNSTQGSLWKPDWHDFAPRIGFAWDLTGDGKTALRGGYGIGYERNFGNVTFNAIQNPPNYETISVTTKNFSQPIVISPANFGPFSASSGSLKLPAASLRNIDYNIKTAYAHLWSTTLEHQFKKSVVVGADYTGSRGVHLYDISILNRPGYGNVFLGDPCSAAAGDCVNYLNSQFSGINRRGSNGYSNYNALNLRANLNNIANSGLTMTFAYTWSHALDNLSSTFSDADANYALTNNGAFNTGYTDPYAPMADKGSSDFDIRHRVTVTAIWALPLFKDKSKLSGKLLGGWELSPLFSARSGSPFSIYDSTNSVAYYVRAALTGPVSSAADKNPTVNGSSPDLYDYLSFNNSIVDHNNNSPYGYSDLPPFPSDMTGRNAFRSPGFWELDLGVYKSFNVTERIKMQLRGEAYNIVNHANMYLIGTSADVTGVDPTAAGQFSVTSCKGCNGTTADNRNLQIALKVIF